MPFAEPSTEFYCPVCGRDLRFIYLWRDPAGDRIRIFCEDCSQLDEYRVLPKEEREIINQEGFQRFAGKRLLRHVFEKERAKEGRDA